MTRPARNAPKASDAPAAAVPRAVRVPTRMTAIRNNSRLRVLRISARARGTTVRASTSTLITTSTALPRARNSAPAPPPDSPARNGRTSIMGTTHRSWKISTPVARRPWGASISPLSVSPLRTMAVLESATRKPTSRDTLQLRWRAMASTQLRATVRPTWAPPPDDDLPSHLAQPAQGELDADGKEQQDDADFRQALDLMHVRYQAECVGAEQDARDDEPREGGELDTMEHQDDEQGDGEDDRQVFEDVVFAHGASRYVIASGPVVVGGDPGHTPRVKTIMESRVAGCKVVARISCSITPEHPGGSLDVGTSRFRLLRQDDAVRDAELSRSEAQLRATARQQEAVAHIGQRALAGTPPDELIAGAVAIVARVLEVPFASVLELRPESRTLLLRAGVGWRDGAVGRTVLPTDADSHAGFVLRSTGPVVVEDLASDARFGSAPLLAAQGVVASLSVLVHGKAR